MKINELPVEILIEIFSYLPSYANVSLVSRQFYNVACKLDDPNVCLTLNKWFFENEKRLKLLQSIKKTNRKIKKVCIDFENPTAGQVRSTISVIEKFTGTITKLEFRKFSLTKFDFLDILSLVPNAIKIRIEWLDLRIDSQPAQKKRRLMLANKDLNLHQLRILVVDSFSMELMSVFNGLPAGVLTKFDCGGFSNELHGLLKRQTNLKELFLFSASDSSTVTTDIFDNVKLETLSWQIAENSANQNNIATILSKQTKLKSLDLRYSTLNEGLMNAVANHLTELESLSVEIPETSVAAFAKMIKLKNLKNLTLSYGQIDTLFKASLVNTRITTLTLEEVELNVELINSLARTAPNLKALRIECDVDYLTINAILRRFNFVEALSITNRFLIVENSHLLVQGDCANLKLLDFTIGCNFGDYQTSPPVVAFIEKWIHYYPNLRRLTLRALNTLNASLLKMLLNGFTKLESLALLFDESELTMDYFHYVFNEKKNLKFFYFANYRSDFQLTPERKDELCAMFHSVRAFEGGIAVASSRNTMKREVKLIENSNFEL